MLHELPMTSVHQADIQVDPPCGFPQCAHPVVYACAILLYTHTGQIGTGHRGITYAQVNIS